MKKLLAVVLTVLMTVSTASCGSQDTTSSEHPSTINLILETGDNAQSIEIDISDMTNPFIYKTLVIDLPEGFVTNDSKNEELGIAMAFKGSTETSTECYTFSDTGYKQSITDFNKESLAEAFQMQFEGFVAFESFTATKCNGFDALDISFKREVAGGKLLQRQYYIFAEDTTYMIAYTTESKKDIKDYEKSLESIIIK